MASPEELADRLNNALTKLSGAERESEILNIITTNNLVQRCHAAQFYEHKYKKELREVIKDQLKGDFRDLAGFLFLNPIELDVTLLHKAFKGTANKEDVVIEILTARSFEYLKVVEKVYKDKMGNDLSKDIEKNFSGEVRKALLYLLGTKRQENPNPDPDFCRAQAEKLLNCKDGEWIKGDNLYKEIFVERSPEELVTIGRCYLQISGTHFLDALEKRMGGTEKKIIREIMYNNIIPHELFAEKLKLAIEGLGTNEEIVNRVLATRCSLDMMEIREMYQFKVQKSLRDAIVGDTSGNYQNLCLFLVGG